MGWGWGLNLDFVPKFDYSEANLYGKITSSVSFCVVGFDMQEGREDCTFLSGSDFNPSSRFTLGKVKLALYYGGPSKLTWTCSFNCALIIFATMMTEKSSLPKLPRAGTDNQSLSAASLHFLSSITDCRKETF